jgi:hypothetical protein
MIDYKDPKAVLEVCGKATEGEWKAVNLNRKEEYAGVYIDAPYRTGGIAIAYDVRMDDDAQFIALARTALPYWVEEAERLRAENARLREENDIQRAGIQELSRGAIIPPAPWNCLFCGFPNLQRHEVCERCGKERQG